MDAKVASTGEMARFETETLQHQGEPEAPDESLQDVDRPGADWSLHGESHARHMVPVVRQILATLTVLTRRLEFRRRNTRSEAE